MTLQCRDDPMVCIDFTILLMGEFLKDWTTLAMMAVLLALLLKLRADQQRKRRLLYGEQMESFVDKRAQNQQATAAWEVKNGKWVEPN
jgi:hypothetical protein